MTAANLRALQKIGLIFLCVSMLFVLETHAVAAPLYTELTRLHVIANSDTQEDQQLKLKVRDGILAVTERLTKDAADALAAREVRASHLETIRCTAQDIVYQNGYTYPVMVSLEDNVWFDHRDYDTFSLPAGKYTALRVKIGAAQGQNWWCVIFPPLCTAACMAEQAEAAGLGSYQIGLIAGDNVELRFWILDLLGKWGK